MSLQQSDDVDERSGAFQLCRVWRRLRNMSVKAQWSLICTGSLTFNSSTFCPHSVFMCFVWIWEQTAIISLYSIDWLVFITETECVYCAVRSTFYFLPTQCVYVFCVYLRTNSDYFTVQHWLVGFYNWDGVFTARYELNEGKTSPLKD